MKISLSIACFFLASFCYANKIDKLANNKEVQFFLKKNISRDFKYRTLFKTTAFISDTTSLANREFSKLDIDKNGLTDLIVHGYETFVVLDNGNEGYMFRDLGRGNSSANELTLIKIDTSNGLCKLLLKQRIKNEDEIDTLIFKFKNFIEYNEKSETEFNFESIKIETKRCLGACPIFEMTLHSDRSVNYDAIEFNDLKGKYNGFLNEDDFHAFIEVLKYIKLDQLKISYAVDWTDDQAIKLEINYNGKTKVIVDYGKIGTFGLSMLYVKIFSWRNKIEWTE